MNEETSLLAQFFTPREAPALDMPQESYCAKDWFAHLFAVKGTLFQGPTSIDGQEPTFHLAGYLLSNPSVYRSLEQNQYLSQSDLRHLILREALAERTSRTTTVDLSLGDLVFSYAEQVMDDLQFFRGIYLGQESIEAIQDKIGFSKDEGPVASPREHATPLEYAAADTLLAQFPLLDVENPPVTSIIDLRYLIVTDIVHKLTKEKVIRDEIETTFLRDDINAQTKLIYSILRFYVGFVNHLSDSIGQNE